jgi:hypothetical protein
MSKESGVDRYGRAKIRSAPPENPLVQRIKMAADDCPPIDSLKRVTNDFPTGCPSTAISLKFEEKHPDVLVIQCSDGRYTSIVSELMQSNGITRYDVMAMPGGPALANASILQSEACKTGTSFLIKGHNTRKVWLLTHSECGYYKYNLNGMPRETITNRQIRDLQMAAIWLRNVNKSLEVYASYIINNNGIASFKTIEIE